METIWNFFARIRRGGWKVINSATGTIVGSYWSRQTAYDVQTELNEALQYIGSKNEYVVRWM